MPIRQVVSGAYDILGLDPLYMADEGKLLSLVTPEAAQDVLEVMKIHPLGKKAAVIGRATGQRPGRVFLNTRVGGVRIVDMLTGEQLPRIC